MRIFSYILILLCAVSCFRDLGNYDYTEVNEAIIAEAGFEQGYDVRRDSDVLNITPDITFTLDEAGTGNYSYEWVAVGQNFYRGQRFVIGTERNLSYPVELPAEEYILYLKVRILIRIWCTAGMSLLMYALSTLSDGFSEVRLRTVEGRWI